MHGEKVELKAVFLTGSLFFWKTGPNYGHLLILYTTILTYFSSDDTGK